MTRDNVIEFLEELKKKDNIKFRKPIQDEKKTKPRIQVIANPFYDSFRDLRKVLAKKHNIFPIYLVYGNATIVSLMKHLPETIEQLKGIEGLGTKKIDLFGADIITNVNVFLNDEKFLKDLFEFKKIREKIISYNKIREDNILEDKILMKLLINKPTNIKELIELGFISTEHIKIFGEYLISQLKGI